MLRRACSARFTAHKNRVGGLGGAPGKGEERGRSGRGRGHRGSPENEENGGSYYDSDEPFLRPGGANRSERRGEWKRECRAIYRKRNGRRQVLESPAIAGRKICWLGRNLRLEVEDDDVIACVSCGTRLAVTAKEKKGGRGEGCSAGWLAGLVCSSALAGKARGRLGRPKMAREAGFLIFLLKKTFLSFFSKTQNKHKF